MKYFIILVLCVAVFADVSHLKLNTDRHYLPPKDDHHHHEQRQHGEQYHYTVSKPKAIHDPENVIVPHNGLNTFVADLPLRKPLFTPAVDFAQAQGSDHVTYATAPNSVFHTQINVQSQGSEFNVPRSEPNFDANGESRGLSGLGARSSNFANNPTFNSGSSYNDDVRKHQQERAYKQEKHTPNTYNEDHQKRTHHHHESEHSRSHEKIYERTSTDERKRPNYQGLNLINGNIAADQAALLPNPPNNLNGNTQGINIINGNLLGKPEHSPQFGYKPKQNEHNFENSRSDIHHTEDNYRKHTSSRDEYHDNHSKKVDEHLPRHTSDHKEYDYHKTHDDHHNKHERKHKEQDHYERKHTTYKNENKEYDHHNEHHDHKEYDKEREHNDHRAHYDQREHHDHRDQDKHREHHDHHDHRNHQDHKTHDDHREHHDHKTHDDHPEHHDHKMHDDHREHHDHKAHDNHRDHHDHKTHDDHREHHDHKAHDDHREHHDHKAHDDQRVHHDHHDRQNHREYNEHHESRDDHYNNNEKTQHHNRQYDHEHDKPHKNQYDHEVDHQRNLKQQHYTSELHETPKYQQSIVAKPAIKIIAFNNNNQPHFQVAPVQAQASPLLGNTENLGEYDPSASAPEVIYKPGDEIDFAETKLVDYYDNRRPLESYSYIRKKPQRKSQPIPQSGTDLRADGYHYAKPSVGFDF